MSFLSPRPYNGAEWRISRQTIGPRGGKSWETVISQPATGGEFRTDLAPGHYKQTYWSNGWPTAKEFDVTEQGTVVGLYESEW